MFNLYGLFKKNNETKEGKIFSNVVASIQGIVIFVIVASMIVYVLNHGGF